MITVLTAVNCTVKTCVLVEMKHKTLNAIFKGRLFMVKAFATASVCSQCHKHWRIDQIWQKSYYNRKGNE